ncbi:MAG: ABC transporter ATP-binding protein [Candidatus Bipolaricaulota bacterium]|nr:ABC transporter ATP-binding protein [Candidatus Bipolaricaulota bacterium]MCX7843896.1 ABC transporter ATP-binding protein [Candidatus Bipolaricaulota bacterium]MDW8151476.1 ABC transporter ATP-binding protein [Candidatus Bipolaricaulota bacterium]
MAELLRIEGLVVEREGRAILRGVDLAVAEGEIHAILGANGTGKSTLAHALMGLSGYRPARGRILFAGQDITEKSVTERARLGITLAWQQPASFEGLTVREYLEIARRGGREGPAVEECLARVGLPPRNYLGRTLNDRLSGGERKRVELAAVLAMNPRLAILDEPDSGIDVLSLDDIMEVIRGMNRRGTTVLLITHREEFARAAHRASHLCGGRILKTGDCAEVVRFYKDFCKECASLPAPELEEVGQDEGRR